MTTAFELSRPEHRGKYQVTVYQRGFRLGGKGASSRGPSGRIEEHGLHVWMGYYENAFRLMRECYAELGRDPAIYPIATIEDAFSHANNVTAADQRHDGTWIPWHAHFPATPGLPGDPSHRFRSPSVADYVRRLLGLARELIESASPALERAAAERVRAPLPASPPTAESLKQSIAQLLRYGVLAGLGGILEAIRLLEFAFELTAPVPDNLLLRLLDAARGAMQAEVERFIAERDDLRRVWSIVDLLFASVRGSIRFRLVTHPRGLEAIDDYDCREWLLMNGASRSSLSCAFVRALYDLAFAFEGGDTSKPRIAAGAGLRGFLRAFFTYRGAFFWKMNAGMGDVVFAPLYEVLSRRGVQFEFFHNLRRAGLATESGDHPHVDQLEFDLQARTLDGSEYRPLQLVGGLPCFPLEPDYAQLEGGDTLRAEPATFESQHDMRVIGQRTLQVGRDFDLVVLALGMGAVPHTCDALLRADGRWRDMVEHVKTVPTKAFQLWLDVDVTDLGWIEHGTSLSAFADPFDTWADMTHVAKRECWPSTPRSVAYFCSVLRDDPSWRGPGGREAAMRAVRADAVRFMNHELAHLWPRAHAKPGQFRWELLKADAQHAGEAAFDTQYWSANVDPSDHYVLSLPGSIKHRISPLDRTFDNLTVAGDWTDSGLNLACVEGAVMSGLLAAHAISRSPSLEQIIGFDHP